MSNNLIRVKLTNHHGDVVHAEGLLDADRLAKASLLERKGRRYSFASITSGTACYAEIGERPYRITEF